MSKKNYVVMDGNTAAAHSAYAFTEVQSTHVSGEEQGYMKLFIPCGGADSPRPIKPVSYTHLDVYKRQSVTNANGYNIVSYRGEENIWGNIWSWIDGMNEENPATFTTGHFGTLYVADHGFVDDSKASPYKNTGIHPDYGSGYISARCV